MYHRVPPPVSPNDTTDTDIATDNPVNSQEKAPKNVSSKLWERFKVLEKKTDEVTRRSTEKRIKYMQKSVLKKVQEEITLPEDRDILREHDVKFGPPVQDDDARENRKRKSSAITSFSTQQEEGAKPGSSSWKDIQPYLTADDHLRRPDKDRYKPETGLETQINTAIKKGEFVKAEDLSDQLSSRQFGSKIAKAFDAHKFVQQKKQQDVKKSTKKKSLHWGFQEKQRWETKGNM